MKIKKLISAFVVLVLMMQLLSLFGTVSKASTIPGPLKFRSNGEFKILQMTDFQHSGNISDSTRRFIHAAILETQPDLIVLTGDNIAGSGSYDSKIRSFMDIFDHYNIPITAIFGNHDKEAGSKAAQLSVYQSYANCLMVEKDPEYSGSLGSGRVGNYNLPITSSDGTNPYSYNLWFFDSGDQSSLRSVIPPQMWYDGISEEAVTWYKWKANLLKQRNNNTIVPAIAFQHIVVPEAGNDANGGNTTNNNPPNEYNYKDENTCPPNDARYYDEVDAFLQTGDVKALFYGHDHKNHYRKNYLNKLDFICTGGTGDGAYIGRYRCARLITLNESNPSNVKTSTVVISGDNTPVDSYGNLNARCSSFSAADIVHTSLTSWQTRTPKTCTTEEVQYRKCASSICPYEETKKISGLASHTGGVWVQTVAPTCTSAGVKTQKCTVCNQTINTQSVPIDTTAHSPGEWIESLTPTCNLTGTEIQKCTRCNVILDTRATPINPIAHNPGAWEQTVAPTCGTQGTEARKCTLCHEILNTRPIAANPSLHLPGEWIQTIAPTCDIPGEEIQKCMICNEILDTRQIEVNPNSHSQGEWTQTVAPTCSTKGTQVLKCTVCQKVMETRQVEINPDSHNSGSWEQTAAATCSAVGTEVRKCTDCQAVLETRQIAIDALAHTPGSWIQTHAPSCGYEGTEVIKCSLCQAVLETRALPINPSAHIPGDLEMTVVPSCGVYGEKIRRCLVCQSITEKQALSYDSICNFIIKSVNSTLPVGETVRLSASRSSQCIAASTEWISSNPSIASVDESGYVKAHRKGTVTITAKTSDGRHTAYKNIFVEDYQPSISIFNSGGQNKIKVDWWKKYSTATLALGYSTSNCSPAKIVWHSSNPDIKIDRQGKITNIGSFSRKSTITVAAYDINNNLIASDNIEIIFYKLSWQLKFLDKQAASGNAVNKNYSPNSIDTQDISANTRQNTSTVSVMLSTVFNYIVSLFTDIFKR